MRLPWVLVLGLVAWVLVSGARPAAAAAPPSGSGMSLQMAPKLNSTKLDGYLNSINQETQGVLPSLNWRQEFTALLHGGGSFDPKKLISGLLKLFFRDVWAGGALLGKLLVIGVACAILEQLSSAFAGQSVAKFAYAVANLALVAVGVSSFDMIVQLIEKTIGQMVGLIEALVPMLAVLLAGLGSVTTAGMFQPIVLVAITLMSTLAQSVVIPLIFLALVLELIGNLTGYSLKGIAGLLKQVGMVSLGLLLTLFVGIISIYRVAGPVADSLILRTGKFLSMSFIPVVGKLFADAAELVFGSAFMLKQAVSITGALAVAFLLLLPILKLLSVVVMFRLSSAVLGPVGAGTVSKSLDIMSGSLVLVGLTLLAISLMFFIALTLVFAGGRGLVF